MGEKPYKGGEAVKIKVINNFHNNSAMFNIKGNGNKYGEIHLSESQSRRFRDVACLYKGTDCECCNHIDIWQGLIRWNWFMSIDRTITLYQQR